MNKIFITGGLGFIGSNFIRMLLKQTDCTKLINLDKQTYAGNPENLADFDGDPRYVFRKGDICDGELLSNLLSEHQPDSVVLLMDLNPLCKRKWLVPYDYWKLSKHTANLKPWIGSQVFVFCMCPPMRCMDH